MLGMRGAALAAQSYLSTNHQKQIGFAAASKNIAITDLSPNIVSINAIFQVFERRVGHGWLKPVIEISLRRYAPRAVYHFGVCGLEGWRCVPKTIFAFYPASQLIRGRLPEIFQSDFYFDSHAWLALDQAGITNYVSCAFNINVCAQLPLSALSRLAPLQNSSHGNNGGYRSQVMLKPIADHPTVRTQGGQDAKQRGLTSFWIFLIGSVAVFF